MFELFFASYLIVGVFILLFCEHGNHVPIWLKAVNIAIVVLLWPAVVLAAITNGTGIVRW